MSGTQLDRECASVFRGARGTRTFTSPRTVVEIKNDAFSGIVSLGAVVLSAGLKELGNKAFQETGVREITIPALLKRIRASTFQGCRALRRATFAEGSRLEAIEKSGFSGTAISEIAIPRGVAVIDNASFSGCRNLKKVAF